MGAEGERGPERKRARHVCPICGRDAARVPKGEPGHNPAFPFCSGPCKLVDLGRWLDGAYVVPGAEADEADASPRLDEEDRE